MRIGVYGFGAVGRGLVNAFYRDHVFDTADVFVYIRTPAKAKDLTHLDGPEVLKKVTFVSDDPFALADDPEISILVEVMGGSGDFPWGVWQKAISSGKILVTANKKLLAQKLPIVTQLLNTHKGKLLYKACVCSVLPALQRFIAAPGPAFDSMLGIVNSSTNILLTRFCGQELSEQMAGVEKMVDEMKAAGVLETDPSDDLLGRDATYKSHILRCLVYKILGPVREPDEDGPNPFSSVTDICHEDLTFASNYFKKPMVMKLVCFIDRDGAQVLPTFVDPHSELGRTGEGDNILVAHAGVYGTVEIKACGAGSQRTGDVVATDVAEAINILKSGADVSHALWPALPTSENTAIPNGRPRLPKGVELFFRYGRDEEIKKGESALFKEHGTVDFPHSVVGRYIYGRYDGHIGCKIFAGLL